MISSIRFFKKILGRILTPILIVTCYMLLTNSGNTLVSIREDVSSALAANESTNYPLAYDVDIPILAYHKVDTEALSTWYVTVDQFTQQMEVLKAYGYQTVSLDDFLDYRDGTSVPPERPVIITFDDGYQGIYDYVSPILNAKDMQGTVFVITGYTGESEDERYDNSWNPTEPLTYHLIWPEIVELDSLGFSIGSHSVTHPNLLDIDPEEVEYEISYSRQDIQEHVGDDEGMSFAYPYGLGDDSPLIRSLIEQSGYHSAVSFSGDDGIANPAESDIFAIPRRAILREVTLVLDNSDPWYFFMRRVDPEFPLPNISLDDFSIIDSAGFERTKYYPGETLSITFLANNWGSPVDIQGTLQLSGTSSIIYNSHWLSPTEDIILEPFANDSEPAQFTYVVSLSETIPIDEYQCSFNVYDSSYLLNFYNKENQPAFSVEQSPISVHSNVSSFELNGNEPFDLWFTVENTLGSASEMYLTVSLSHGLKVISSFPEEKWSHLPIGSEVKIRDCYEDCPLSQFIISEACEENFGNGKRSYRLTVQSEIGATESEWVGFRLSMRLPEGQLTPDWYLRNPLSGKVDQQGWSAWSLPVLVHRNDLFIPLLEKH